MDAPPPTESARRAAHTGTALHHLTEGPGDAPLLVLGPSLGTSAAVWEPHLRELAADFRLLRFDLPGHGGSGPGVLRDPSPGGTTMDDLARLVLDLADRYGRRRFHYAGISLGGAIGTALAALHPERVASLALVGSSATFGDPGRWHARAAEVRARGTGHLLADSPGRWFADAGAAATPRGAALLGDLAGADPTGYAACCDAVASCDLVLDLPRVTAPTLVVTGARDVATPASHAEELAAGIPGARLVTVGSGHLTGSPAEARELTAVLRDHLTAAL
ncbi:alpha/beta fold hydrolase [Streptomyces sp. NPDC048514]|uniref:alpha/beta fold hydrolase n=1 Tax=Streptomyces sp. NPDC048514 TaxID=3365564 RepID=UPI00371233D4